MRVKFKAYILQDTGPISTAGCKGGAAEVVHRPRQVCSSNKNINEIRIAGNQQRHQGWKGGWVQGNMVSAAARVYNGGLGALPRSPVGFRGKAPGHAVP